MKPSIPILMYHQVTPHPLPGFRKYTVTPKAFAAQMNWLALAGYVTIDLDSLLGHRSNGTILPSRPVIITFDDGFQDCVDYAIPILLARGFTAIFYLVAGLVGQSSRWLAIERGFELPMMDWSAARHLEAQGFHCGSHGMSHSRLANLPASACRNELRDSQRLLEDQLGHEVTHLAYPFGSYNERVRALAAETGYRSACTVRINLSAPDDDPLALHRVPVTGQDSLLDFICRLYTAHTISELLRSMAQGAWGRLRHAQVHTAQ